MSTLKTHNLQSPDAGSVNIALASNAGMVVTGISTFSNDVVIPDKIIHSGDADTAIRFPADDTFSVETAGSERFRIKSDGYVGVNETNPQYPLHVSGATTDPSPDGTGILMGLQHEHAAIHLNAADTKGCLIDFSVPNTDRKGGILYYHSNNPTAGNRDAMLFYTNGQNERLRITSTGRIEIGTGTGVFGSAPIEIKVSSSSGWSDYPEHISIVDQKAYDASDNGGGIVFSGKYNNSGSVTTFSSIHSKKANTTDGNFGGILTFNTREHGNSNFERMRIDSLGRVFINSVGPTTPTADYRSLNLVAHAHSEAGISFSRSHVTMGSGNSGGKSIILLSDGALSIQTHNVAERMRIDSSGRVVIGGTSAYIGGAALAVLGTGTTPNTYGSFAIGKVGANPTAGTTLANIRLNGGQIGTRRGAEINAVANGNWTDGSSHPTKLTFAVANVNSASATERYQINHYGHHIFTNENVFPASGSPGTNSFKGLTQLGYQHWGWRQYYSGQFNLTQNGTKDLISNNTAHDDIIFWFNVKGFHANRTFSAVYGTIGGYGLNIGSTVTGVANNYSLSASNIGTGRNVLRFTSTSPYGANWWVWGWYSGTSGTGTHTGYSAAQNF